MAARSTIHRVIAGGVAWRACIIVLVLTAIVAAATATCARSIIYVVPSGAGSQSGIDWANAKDLAAAVADASSGDELWVRAGIYKPVSQTDPFDPRTATFALKGGVAIYGGFNGTETMRGSRDWQLNVTILSGDIGRLHDNSDNSYHVVTASSANASAILDGFDISDGNANESYSDSSKCGGGIYSEHNSLTLSNITFRDNSGINGGGMCDKGGYLILDNVTFTRNSAINGGGMINGDSSNLTLTNVIFSDNSAFNGGGMYNEGDSPTLTNVTFRGNSVEGSGGGMLSGGSPRLTNVAFSENLAGIGGGMAIGGSPILSNVTFRRNLAKGEGGGMHNSGNPTLTNVTFTGNSAQGGGGMLNYGGSPTLINVVFTSNSAKNRGDNNGNGGGMCNWNGNPTLTNVSFSGNSAESLGGGVSNWSSNGTLTNVTLSGNLAGIFGGGIFNSESSPTLTNVTISGNSARGGGGVYNYSNNSPVIRNSILWGNANGAILPPLATVSYSIVQDGYTGVGNLNVDPKFVTPIRNSPPTTTGKLHLQEGSPAINAGDNNVMNPTLPTTDLDGNPRIAFGIVDMGAYEMQPPLATPTPTPTSYFVFLPLLTGR